MKTGGSIFLWSIIVICGSPASRRRTATSTTTSAATRCRRPRSSATTTIQLTYDDVEREFARVPAADEPQRPADRPAGSVTDS